MLTVNAAPKMEGRARSRRSGRSRPSATCAISTGSSSRAALVDTSLSDGKIGYIHLPNTAGDGNRMLQKLFYSQVTKPALDRGRPLQRGWVHSRPHDRDAVAHDVVVLDAPRGRVVHDTRVPPRRPQGDADQRLRRVGRRCALPYYFRKAGLGKLIGTTTWGGLIGLSGNPMLDRRRRRAVSHLPALRHRRSLGRRERGCGSGHRGPRDTPEQIAAGGDPSIEKAVETLLAQLESYRGEPATPTPPDMKK